MNTVYERYEAICGLDSDNSDAAREIALTALADENALIRHEAAFVLGCIGSGSESEVTALEFAMKDKSPFVRHESALSLSCIGSRSSLEVLTEGIDDPCEEVAQSCEIAIQRLLERRLNQ